MILYLYKYVDMNYTIRILDPKDDFVEALDIFLSAKKVMRTPLIRYSENLANDMNNPRTVYFGAFKDGELVAYMRYTAWGTLPVYSIGNMNIKSGVLQRYDFSNADHPIIPLMDTILSIAESKGWYTWYYNRSLANSYHKLQLEKKDLLYRCTLGYDATLNQYRYDRYVDEVIPAGEVAQYTVHKAILGETKFDYGYMVVKCCLKPEYRATPNYFNEETIKECMKTTPKIKNI